MHLKYIKNLHTEEFRGMVKEENLFIFLDEEKKGIKRLHLFLEV